MAVAIPQTCVFRIFSHKTDSIFICLLLLSVHFSALCCQSNSFFCHFSIQFLDQGGLASDPWLPAPPRLLPCNAYSTQTHTLRQAMLMPYSELCFCLSPRLEDSSPGYCQGCFLPPLRSARRSPHSNFHPPHLSGNPQSSYSLHCFI